MKKIVHLDWISVGAVLFLLVSGLITIYSFSVGVGRKEEVGLFYRQLVFLGIGIGLFLFFSFYDYRTWRKYSNFLYFLSLILLFVVLFFGSNIRGTSGWFNLGLFNFQPVELVKIFSIIFLASYFVRIGSMRIGFKEFLVSFLIIIFPVFLTLKQPDLGSASVLLVIWFSMAFFAGVEKKYLLGLILIGFLSLSLSWGVILKDYQKERIQTFLDPGRDPLGSGYNVIQSMIAIGSGGISGKGIGYSSQSRLDFLPERHTDFVFASINETFGMIGSISTIGFFWLLFYRLFYIAKKARDRFGRLMVGGVLSMLAYQVVVNIGMNVGIVPVTGISLPFLSYGGSFLLASMIGFGICQNVWSNRIKMVLGDDN